MNLRAHRPSGGHRITAGLLITVALTLSWTACGPGDPAELFPEGSNILLITIDTLRADHLSSYGYPRQTSPVIDRLAAEGLRFDRAMVQWPKTGPSFASIFTATYPKDNGIVRKVGIPIPIEYEMLAEKLSAQGYRTAAIVANGAAGSDFGFGQGFDSFYETWKVEGLDEHSVAWQVTDEALRVASGLPDDRPWFLWVHYLDPHFPYTPPEGFADRFVGDEHYDPTEPIRISPRHRTQQIGGIGYSQDLGGPAELAFYVARYDEEIAYTDSEIGRLLEGLTDKGRMESTLTVVTSDHGESLGEHRYFFDHGRFSFQTCLRVPLILHYPGVIAPADDLQPVELLDLSPTILEVAGVELEDGVWKQGRSLLPRIFGTDEPGEPIAFSEAGWGLQGRWQKVAQDSRYKLIYVLEGGSQRYIGGKGQRWVLFDLKEDPGETENLVKVRRREGKRLREALEAWLYAEKYPVGNAEVTGEEGEMDEKTREQLKALGYIQ